MMRLTRKLYSEPEDKEDENDEKTWKRRRNIGIIGAGTGGVLALGGKYGLGEKSGVSKQISKNTLRTIKGGGIVLAGAGTLLGVGSEIKRRKLKKKKEDENKA